MLAGHLNRCLQKSGYMQMWSVERYLVGLLGEGERSPCLQKLENGERLEVD